MAFDAESWQLDDLVWQTEPRSMTIRNRNVSEDNTLSPQDVVYTPPSQADRSERDFPPLFDTSAADLPYSPLTPSYPAHVMDEDFGYLPDFHEGYDFIPQDAPQFAHVQQYIQQQPQFPQAAHYPYQPHYQQQHVRALPSSSRQTRTLLPANNATRTERKQRPRKGGRVKHSKLKDETRKQASDMRKTGACWRCAFQRDTCPSGSPCERCVKAQEKGVLYNIPCDRSKLPDFIHDFLPATMTYTYQKQIIQDCVQSEVGRWTPNSFEISLTSGWGAHLKWTVHEFVPKSEDMLTQYQYFQNKETRLMERITKYSPPLVVKTLDSNDYMDHYMEELFHNLNDFSEMCYASESRFETFPEDLLNSLCQLNSTRNQALRDLVRKVIRMMILTYIMTHTLTIVQTTLPSVLQRVRHPLGAETQKHTSPRLANRQLKFYFSVMREAIYKDLLKWGQRTLHASESKDGTWILVFTAMLGFAMVLEEIQCNLQIQADAKASKGEKSWVEAQTEAINACERIDERFDLLCRLFRYRYRSDSWTHGSFGNNTPLLRDQAELDFLHRLKRLVETKADYLRERRAVPLGHDYQCKYTSRLVAKFLLPFFES